MVPGRPFGSVPLFGLTPAGAVKELGFDVLAEDFTPGPLPPISEAFAIAHAHYAWPDQESASASAIVASLQSSNQVDLPIGLVETAVLALTGPNAAAPNPSVCSFCLERVKSLLDDSKAQTLI